VIYGAHFPTCTFLCVSIVPPTLSAILLMFSNTLVSYLNMLGLQRVFKGGNRQPHMLG